MKFNENHRKSRKVEATRRLELLVHELGLDSKVLEWISQGTIACSIEFSQTSMTRSIEEYYVAKGPVVDFQECTGYTVYHVVDSDDGIYLFYIDDNEICWADNIIDDGRINVFFHSYKKETPSEYADVKFSSNNGALIVER